MTGVLKSGSLSLRERVRPLAATAPYGAPAADPEREQLAGEVEALTAALAARDDRIAGLGEEVARAFETGKAEGREAGRVTSGSPSITLKKNIGLAYLPADRAAIGMSFEVMVRNKLAEAKIVKTPFYKRTGI